MTRSFPAALHFGQFLLLGGFLPSAHGLVLSGRVAYHNSSSIGDVTGADKAPLEYADFIGYAGGEDAAPSHEVPDFLRRFQYQTYSSGGSRRGRCPHWNQTQHDLHRIRRRSRLGGVNASTRAAKTEPVNLFLFVPPYWGSTALLSLIASSPRATTLCEAGTANCEGTWLLIKAGLMQEGTRWDPELPDWSEAFRLFSSIWEEGKQVRVEKSPPNIAKVAELVKYFAKRKDEVAFLVMTRSPCFTTRGTDMDWRKYALILAEALDVLKVSGSKHKVVRYEDLLFDPYGTASEILDFLPSLEALDPNLNNLPQVSDVNKGMSIVDYILAEGPFDNPAGSTFASSSDALARQLGC